jgi:hypothetical protein
MAQLEAAQREVEAASEAAAGTATTLESEREAARVQAAAAAAELEMVETAAEEAATAADAANARADAAEVAKNAALSAGHLHHVTNCSFFSLEFEERPALGVLRSILAYWRYVLSTLRKGRFRQHISARLRARGCPDGSGCRTGRGSGREGRGAGSGRARRGGGGSGDGG